MVREKYDAVKEHEVVGKYPGGKAVLLPGCPDGYPELPKLYRPIPLYENYRLNLTEQTPYWIPACGWFFCDVNMFRPRQHPDNLGNRQCLDGGPGIDYDNEIGSIVNGWFDLPLEWEPQSGGAMTRPGNPKVISMSNWEEQIEMPNLDDLDWDEIKAMNVDYLASDKVNQLGIQFGFWERMMNLMDVTNACFALMLEDEEDGVRRFLDALADLYIDYIGRMMEVGRIDAVYLHDDWGTQNAPFFSLETARKFFVPPMKRVVDFCHQNGILFEHHCCGNAMELVPAMEECGSDFWIPQAGINDVDYLIDHYKRKLGYHISFGIYMPIIAKGTSEDEVREMARAWVEKYKDAHVMYCSNPDLGKEIESDPALATLWEDAVYEYSRKAYQDAA